MGQVTFALAFFAGIASFLSPCVLPLVPAYLAYLAGSTAGEVRAGGANVRRRVFFSSVFFVAGFSAVFSVLGVLLQGVLSGASLPVREYMGYAGGALIILFGLVTLGAVKIPALMVERRLPVVKTPYRYLSAFLFGGAFAAGWSPCFGAVLGSVLTLAATRPGEAFPLLAAYSVGLGLPFVVAGAFLSQAASAVKKVGIRLRWLNAASGALMVLLGILVFTGTLNLVFPA